MANTNIKFQVLAFLVAVLLTTFSLGVEPSSCPYEAPAHLIEPHDLCWNLAGGTQAKVDIMMKYNPGTDCNNLVVGDIICVPIVG
ncbi:hypothetical protein LINGRAHAP2_LOCUS36526, partial [Linum grandiflorum]